MADDENPIWKTIECDEANIRVGQRLLEEYRLMALYERIPGLFDMDREIQGALADASEHPLTRRDASGLWVAAWDFILRVFLHLSARHEFLYAVGHLLRGHPLEMAPHVRSMVEDAGIAYLSKSEPDLGDLYIGGQLHAYRDRTTRGKILPLSDPLTADLNKSFEVASELTHANFAKLAPRIKADLGAGGFRTTYEFHHLDDKDPRFFLMCAAWLLTVSKRVLRLLGAAHGLPDGVWYRRLEDFERNLDFLLERLRPQVRAEESADLSPEALIVVVDAFGSIKSPAAYRERER